jgi:hypothetical protein
LSICVCVSRRNAIDFEQLLVRGEQGCLSAPIKAIKDQPLRAMTRLKPQNLHFFPRTRHRSPYEPLLDRAGHTESGGLAQFCDVSCLMVVIYDAGPVRHSPPRNLAVSLGFRSTNLALCGPQWQKTLDGHFLPLWAISRFGSVRLYVSAGSAIYSESPKSSIDPPMP